MTDADEFGGTRWSPADPAELAYDAAITRLSRAVTPPFWPLGALLRLSGAAALLQPPVAAALLAVPWLRVLSAAPTATDWSGATAAGGRAKLQTGYLQRV